VTTRPSSHVAWAAPEYQADGTIRPTHYAFERTIGGEWDVRREGRPHLRLGPGYRLLEVSHCGICSTDLVRHRLPFPLPQVTGHEVVARDESGKTVVVEINASHAARGLPRTAWCAHCRAGMPTHCPTRLVLGIHDLPGGFSPWILAPVAAVLAVPPGLDAATATFVEPFAAALGAVRSLGLAAGERVLVLGPGRLGSLVVAALAVWRQRVRGRFEILVAGRRSAALARARALGADETLRLDGLAALDRMADVVVETTGSPEGLALALRLASREVHVKSTTGQPTLGATHLTELVVDEVSLLPWDPGGTLPTGAASVVVLESAPADVRRALTAAGLRVVPPAEVTALPLGAADLAVAASCAEVDAILRPHPGVERGLVRPRGAILLIGAASQPAGGLVATLRSRALRLSSTRCGDFGSALDVLAGSDLCHRLAERMVTDVVPAARLGEGLARAAAGGGKVIVAHPRGLL
jgi:threonine dehydrogenase-like Zn-dependent dehydrogenase